MEAPNQTTTGFSFAVTHAGKSDLERSGRKNLSRMAEIKKALDEDCRQKPSVGELAQKVGLSLGYFTKMFTRYTGLTPHRYLVQRRMEHAKELNPLTSTCVCGSMGN